MRDWEHIAAVLKRILDNEGINLAWDGQNLRVYLERELTGYDSEIELIVKAVDMDIPTKLLSVRHGSHEEQLRKKQICEGNLVRMLQIEEADAYSLIELFISALDIREGESENKNGVPEPGMSVDSSKPVSLKRRILLVTAGIVVFFLGASLFANYFFDIYLQDHMNDVLAVTFYDDLAQKPLFAGYDFRMKAWVWEEKIPDGYHRCFARNGGVVAPRNCNHLLDYGGLASNIREIDFHDSFDTSKVQIMWGMFSGFKGKELDLSCFNTSQVTDMSHMFSACENLTTLDLSSFDTSQVTNMAYMFSNCENLMAVDLNSFDTSQVTDMNHMFWRCSSLTDLDITSFDMSSADTTGIFGETPFE